MGYLFGGLPVVAALLAVPQFVPQLLRLARTGNIAGLSWSWAALTSVNNAAWFAYFLLSSLWTALIPAGSAAVLAGLVAILLARHGVSVGRHATVLMLGWAVTLTAAAGAFGRAGLGSALTIAFVLQVAPSVWTAYRADDTSGISASTWLLIFGELFCWGAFGLYRSDVRLTVLGLTGVVASLLVLGRVAIRRPSVVGCR